MQNPYTMSYSEHLNANPDFYKFIHELCHTMGLGHASGYEETPSGGVYFMNEYTYGDPDDLEDYLLYIEESSKLDFHYGEKSCTTDCPLDLSCPKCDHLDFGTLIDDNLIDGGYNLGFTDCTGNYEDQVDFSFFIESGCEAYEDITIKVSFVDGSGTFTNYPSGFTPNGPTEVTMDIDIASNEYYKFDFSINDLIFNFDALVMRIEIEGYNPASGTNFNSFAVFPPIIISGTERTSDMTGAKQSALKKDDPKTILLDGRLVFDGGFIFNASKNILTNATILVAKPSADIVCTSMPPTSTKTTTLFENVNIETCGDFTWTGIKVYSGSTMDMNNCEINDAYKGLSVIHQNENQPAPDIKIQNSEFINNYIGLDLSSSFSSSAPTMDPLKNVNFICNRDLFPYGVSNFVMETDRTYYGIVASDIPMISLGFNEEAFGDDRYNTFKGLKNGVLLENANLISTGSNFQSIGSFLNTFYNGVPIEHHGMGIIANEASSVTVQGNQANIFKDCTHGVIADDAAVTITDATFQNIRHSGITVKNSTGAILVANNDIKLKKYATAGINLLDNNTTVSPIIRNNTVDVYSSVGTRGINISELLPMTNYLVEQNTINLAYFNAYGIRSINGGNNTYENNIVNITDDNDIGLSWAIRDDGSTNNTYKCNHISGAFIPVENRQTVGLNLRNSAQAKVLCNNFENTTYGFQLWGLGTESEVKGNDFLNHHTGVYYGLYPSQGDAFSGEQRHYGNTWNNGTFLDEGAEHLSTDPFIVGQSLYFGDPTINPNFITQETSVADWVQPDIDNNDLTFYCAQSGQDICSNPSPPPGSNWTSGGTSGGPLGLSGDIAMGNITTGSYPIALNYTADQQLYNGLMNSGESVGNMASVYQNFLATMQGSDIASLYEINNDLIASYSSSMAQQANSDALALQNAILTYQSSYAQVLQGQ